MFDEEQFFFAYLRIVKGTQTAAEVAEGVSKTMKTKDAAQVAAYYESIVDAIRLQASEAFERVKHSLDRIHYAMLVYWEKHLVSTVYLGYTCRALDPFLGPEF